MICSHAALRAARCLLALSLFAKHPVPRTLLYSRRISFAQARSEQKYGPNNNISEAREGTGMGYLAWILAFGHATLCTSEQGGHRRIMEAAQLQGGSECLCHPTGRRRSGSLHEFPQELQADIEAAVVVAHACGSLLGDIGHDAQTYTQQTREAERLL